MDREEREQPQQSNQQNNGQSTYPSLYVASAPMTLPTPPPQYSDVVPSFPQQPQTPFLKHQEQLPIQQQPQVQQVIVMQIPLQNHPTNTICPSCHAHIVTRVASEANMNTHLAAVLLCLICIPCVFVPYCMESCQTSVHYCPNCSAYVGSYPART